LWAEGGGKSPQNVVGKKPLKASKPIFKSAGYVDKLLNAFMLPGDYVLAPELKEILVQAIASTSAAQSN
jgi:hypothetical protein